jgi:hypothetical protein
LLSSLSSSTSLPVYYFCNIIIFSIFKGKIGQAARKERERIFEGFVM